MRLLALLLLLSVHAHAAPCSSQSVGPCTPDQTEKDAILDLIRAARQEDAARKSYAKMRNDAYYAGDYITAKQDDEYTIDSDAQMNAFFSKALAATMTAYHVGPTTMSGEVVAPKDPLERGAWSAGIVAKWDPQVVFADQDILQMWGPHEGPHPHYGGGELNPRDIAGFTYPDGVVKIMAQNLFDAQDHSNPGEIAAIIDHETQHFNDLLTRGFFSKEDCELRAYTAELRDSAAFELTQEQKDGIKANKDRFETALKGGTLTSYFPDAQQETTLELKYREAQKQLRVFNAKSQELSRLADQQRQANRDAAKAQVIAEAVGKVRSCGFQPLYKADGNFNGFSRNDRGWQLTYTVSHPMSLDEFKVGLWFASTCFDMTMQPQDTLPEESGTRAEGFVIADAHWNEPGFKADSQFNVLPEQQARCVIYLHDHWKPSLDAKGLKRLYSDAAKEYKKGMDAAWRETLRDRKEEEDADRARRERDEPQGQPGGGRSGSGPSPVQGHPRAPIQCGFNASGAYCR